MGWKEVAVTAMLLAASAGHGGGGATPPGWRELAAAGQTYDAAERDTAAKAVESLSKDLRKRALETLDAMARVPPGAQGLQAAHDALMAALPGMEAPDAAFSGEGPNRGVLRRAGVMVLHGLVAREARRVAKSDKPDAEAATLLGTVVGLKGVDAVTRNQLKEEARQGLGDALYLRALPASGPSQKGRAP
jgi:hypothetical protein